MSQNRTFSQGGSDFSTVNVEGFDMMNMAPYKSVLLSQSSQGFRFSQEAIVNETKEPHDDHVLIPVSTQDYVQQYKSVKPSKKDIQDPLLSRSFVMTKIQPFPGHHVDEYIESMDTEEDQRVAQNLATTGHAGFSQIFFEEMTPNPSPLSQNDAQFEFHGHDDSNDRPSNLQANIRPDSPGQWYKGSAVQCESSSSLMSVQSDVSMKSGRRSSTSSSKSSSKKSDAKREINRLASARLRARKNMELRNLEAQYEAAREEERKAVLNQQNLLLEMKRQYDALLVMIENRDKDKKPAKSRARK